MSPRRLVTWEWSISKQGNAEGENDDACRVERIPNDGGAETILIAMSDGATEAVYSGHWARALVDAAEADWPSIGPDLEARLLPIRQSFQPFDPQAELPWYVREKFLTQGSQATLLAATLTQAAAHGVFSLRAVAVGDSCLLLFRITDREYAYRAFPLEKAGDFGADPVLVRNRPSASPLKYQQFEAEMHSGDVLLVCTDAVAKWAMDCLESGGANLLFDALLHLTATVPATAPETDQPAPEMPEDAVEQPLSYWQRLLQKLRRDRTAPPRDREEAAIEAPGEPALADPALAGSPDFADFVGRYRQQDAKPRMRNDDSTLVVCASLGADVRFRSGQAILRAHRDAAGKLPVHCRQEFQS